MFRAILATVFSFVILDTLWIQCVAISWYQALLPHLLRMHHGAVQANVPSAILFYMIVLPSLIWLVVRPEQKTSCAFVNGAVAGLMSYATYSFTCMALFKGWTWSLAITDTLWGVVLCAVSCAIGVYVKQR